jgi:hypothetical protein
MGARQREYLHRENINGLRNQATALKMKAAATSSSLSGKRPYRFSAGTSYAAPTTASRMLNCGTCRMAALQGKSFARLITVSLAAMGYSFAKIRFSLVEP